MSEGFEWFEVARSILLENRTNRRIVKFVREFRIVREKDLFAHPLGSALLRLLNSERDPLTLTLRGHLIVERLLEEIISRKFRFSEELLGQQWFSFSAKVAVLRSRNYLDASLNRDIKALNSLRNRFAHRLSFDVADFNISQFYYCDRFARVGDGMSKEGRRAAHTYFLLLVLHSVLMRLTERHPFIAEVTTRDA